MVYYLHMPQSPHHRRSIRLPGYDYTQNGAYFVTLITQGRQELFGKVLQDDIFLYPTGQLAYHAWLWLARQYPYLTLGEFCVMPNHLHGILIIDHNGTQPVNVKSLGRLIGAYKTVSTKWINQLRNAPGKKLWQRNYYEHIVRNDDEMAKISLYIADNPARWHRDRNHTPMLATH